MNFVINIKKNTFFLKYLFDSPYENKNYPLLKKKTPTKARVLILS